MSINRVEIAGNLTRDAELRTAAGGTVVLSFCVAVNERRRDRETGEWRDRANFVDCSMFGRRAEALGRYLTRGTKVAVDGRLRYSSWEDASTGARRSRLGVVVDDIDLMARGGQAAQDAVGAVAEAFPGAPVVQVADQDIPF